MKTHLPLGCASCPLNRRRFLTRTAWTTAGLVGLGGVHGRAQEAGSTSPARTTRVRIVYALHAARQPGPDWPNQGFNFQPVMDRIEGELRRRCPGFEFVASQAAGPEQAKGILEQDRAAGNIDAYVVYQMNCWNQVIQTIATSGKPVLYADFQFGGSGGFLVYTAALLRAPTRNVGFVASSDIADLVDGVKKLATVGGGGAPADFAAATARDRVNRTGAGASPARVADEVKCLSASDCLGRMKEARIVAVRDQTSGDEPSIAGIPIVRIPFEELNAAWKNADRDESGQIADRWQSGAARVEGVSRETLEDSAAMYLAEKAILAKHEALAITINCLGGFYGGHIHAYPCLGFHQLLNDGLVGGCECDVRSTATLVIGNLLTGGRPGYISDPVLDTSKRQIIYAHCVATNKPLGPRSAGNAFEILTHSEDRQGASVRSLLPPDYLVTTLQVDAGRREILFHQAVTVGNDPDDRACRTKLCAEPIGDLEKLFTFWDQWGWHRVTFYGDLSKPIRELADALGWAVVNEA